MPDLAAADRAMLGWALTLTRSPRASAEGGVEALRAQGFDDRAILDICQVTAYYNYVNRLAEGLAIELEPGWAEEDLTVGAAEFSEWKGRMQGGGV
ncbi:MAG: hypothetical protein R3E98_04345 [Gemmatimonadota bacterium]|nr:hypothetical protein [Gemmatimonadota bacterium]